MTSQEEVLYRPAVEVLLEYNDYLYLNHRLLKQQPIELPAIIFTQFTSCSRRP